jgi:hypothetical protein
MKPSAMDALNAVVAWLAIASFACASSPALAQTTKRFMAEDVTNPAAFYPEGRSSSPKGCWLQKWRRIASCCSARPSRKVKWSQAGCGATSVKQIPGGGYWVLCHLAHEVIRLDASFRTIDTGSVFELRQADHLAQRCLGRLEREPLPELIGVLFAARRPRKAASFSSTSTRTRRRTWSGQSAMRMAFSCRKDRSRVLVSEMLNRRMLSYPLLGKGKVGTPSVFFDFKNAPAVAQPYDLSGPDGIAAFKDGDILVADYGNGRVLLLSGEGRFLQEIKVQYRFVTNMAITADQKSVYFTMTENNSSADLHGMVQRFSVHSTKSH